MALDLDGNEEVIDEAWFERAKKFRADHVASQEAKRQWRATRTRSTTSLAEPRTFERETNDMST